MSTRHLDIREGLNGPAGLLTAVIASAVRDCFAQDRRQAKSGWAYLGGELYQHHLAWLNLPPDAWPADLDELPDAELVELVDRIFSNG